MTGTLHFRSTWFHLGLLLFLLSCCCSSHAIAPLSSITRGGSSPYPEDHLPDQETVQDRVDAWRNLQQQKYSHQSAQQRLSPRDDQGKFKLLASVSRTSRAMIFFVLMWRDVHLYEVADQSMKGLSRLFMVTPLCLLFIANLAGVVSSFTSPSHSAKKRLKAILNLDKFVEVLLILYNFCRLTVWPSKYKPREMYISSILHSVFFIAQSHTFTKVSWDEMRENTDMPERSTSTTAEPAYTSTSSYSYEVGRDGSYETTGTQRQSSPFAEEPQQQQYYDGKMPPPTTQSYDG